MCYYLNVHFHGQMVKQDGLCTCDVNIVSNINETLRCDVLLSDMPLSALRKYRVVNKKFFCGEFISPLIIKVAYVIL